MVAKGADVDRDTPRGIDAEPFICTAPARLAGEARFACQRLLSIASWALTETAGQIAAAFKKFFNVAAPTGTVTADLPTVLIADRKVVEGVFYGLYPLLLEKLGDLWSDPLDELHGASQHLGYLLLGRLLTPVRRIKQPRDFLLRQWRHAARERRIGD